MSDPRSLLERESRRFIQQDGAFERLVRRRTRQRRNQRIAAGVVGIAVFVAAIWIVTSGLSFDRTETPAVPGPAETGPTVAPDPDAEGIIGLPPEGATPSTPESGKLVLQLEGTTPGSTVFPGTIWVYADGRMIWSRLFEDLPGSTGLVEQHLTPEGVEFLRSNALSTGLFEHDLDLAAGDEAPFFSIQVRDRDRLIRVTWARHGALQDPNPAEATPGQAAALESLDALITDPASWPASAWEDREIREYVPATYAICSRGFPKPVEPTRVLTLMPEGARNLLGSDFGLRDELEACANVTTEEARILAGILDAAGIVRANLAPGEYWLRYLLADPQHARNEIWINFQPILPHGESTWLGPG